MKNIILLITCLLIHTLGYAQFKAGDKVNINDPYNGDLYTAGGTVDIYAPIYGDLVVTGGEITVADTIQQDLLMAGGRINLIGPVKDDIRAAGGDITIQSLVGGDLMVFGGNIHIKRDAKIGGNLVVFGGNIKSEGQVLGNVYGYGGEISVDNKVGGDVKLKAGSIDLNSQVGGSVEATAEHLYLGNSSMIQGDLRYWTEDGQQNIDQSLVNGTISYDADLAYDPKPSAWWLGGMAFGLFVWYVFAAFLLLLVIQLLFGRQLNKVSGSSMEKIGEKVGYGFLYVLGVPIVILILFGLFIGIPIGLFILCLYIFSLLFSYSIGSLLFVHHLNGRGDHSWSPIVIVALALVGVFILRVISLIPVLGWLIGLLVVVWTYGTLINHYIVNRESTSNQ